MAELCDSSAHYTAIMKLAGAGSSTFEDGSPIPQGMAVSDVMTHLGIDRTEARLLLRHLVEVGALYPSGHSHAVRYFTSKPKYHGTDGLRAALLEYAEKSKANGFTRGQFLSEFPFAKSTVYQVVSALLQERPPQLARRGHTNNMRYYLPKHAPVVAKKRQRTTKV